MYLTNFPIRQELQLAVDLADSANPAVAGGVARQQWTFEEFVHFWPKQSLTCRLLFNLKIDVEFSAHPLSAERADLLSTLFDETAFDC